MLPKKSKKISKIVLISLVFFCVALVALLAFTFSYKIQQDSKRFSYAEGVEQFHGPHLSEENLVQKISLADILIKPIVVAAPVLSNLITYETELHSADAARNRTTERKRLPFVFSPTKVVVLPAPSPVVTPVTATSTPLAIVKSIVSTSTATSTIKVTPLAVVSPVVASSSTTTPVASLASVSSLSSPTPVRDFGIAAGGGLTWLSQQDLNTYFQSLKDLGITWVRWDIPWVDVQAGGPSSYDWVGVDRVAATAKQYGIKSVGIIGYAPAWASDSGCVKGSLCAPSDIKAFASFASIAASRYKGSIDYWEIWNEPNIPGFWSPKPSVEQYSSLLKESYLEIKKANPQAIVVTGGLSSADNSPDGSISPLTFVEGIYSNGGKDSFDALAVHPYSYPVAPTYLATWNSWQQMQQIRLSLVAHGDATKKIWITEYGAPTGGPGTSHEVDQLKFTYGADYMSETAQQTLITQMLGDYLRMSSWVGPVFWYSLHDNSATTNTPENFFGLLRYDWSKKPAYFTLKSFISGN